MEKTSKYKNEKDNKVFQQLFYKYLPYWPLFLTLLVISVGSLFIYLKLNTPVYETTASILIKDETKGQEDSKMEDVLNLFGTKKTVENETQILSSNEILKVVINKLHLYAPVTEELGWNGKIIKSAFLTSPVMIDVPNPDLIQDSKKIYFTVSKDRKNVLIDGKQYPMNEWVESPWGKIRFQKNSFGKPESVIGENRMYFSLIKMDKIINAVTKNLVVTPVSRQSSVINLKIRDEIPERGETILKNIVDAYNTSAIERKNSIAMKTLEFIESRLKNVGSQLDSVESGIQKYRDRSGIVDISEQSRLYLQSIEENDKEINTLNMRMSALNEVENYVQSKSGQGDIVPSTINIEDPTLSQLVNKLSASQSQYESLKKTTAENNPILLSLQEEINKTKPSILENIRNQKKSIASGKSYLDQVNNKYSSMLSTVPKKERELVEVSRQQNIKNDIYKFLLQKREETAYSISSALPDCFLVDQPTTSLFPVSPKKPLLALLAAFAPFILGFLVVSLKDSMNSKVLYRKDIESLTKFPIIGELMFEKLEEPIVTKNAQRSFLQEQFRQIRAALKYQGNPKGNVKRILVTSSIKGEGKSFVSSNLAVSIARSGKKVALLELDLHQPKLREMFEIGNCAGITDYLQGKATEKQIIIPTDVQPNLSLIPAGFLIEDPTELLLNGKLEILLNYLDTVFDVLIIDTAPVLALTDATSISPLVNLVLYIIRHDHTPKTHIEFLDENMEAHNIENVALVFNGVKKRGFGRYSYGYGSGYGYGSKSSYDAYSKKKKVA